MQQVLADRFQLGQRLGSGGQGQVYRGIDLVTQATVAIKLMDKGNSPEELARFQLEGRLAARIRDPHLIAAWHFGESEGQHFIVFDYMPGVMPLTHMFDHGRVDPARVCDVALQVLDAVATLHGAGVVHQDVSPANCLWRERETGRLEVFLVDLGCAATRLPITGASGRERERGGTLYYTAPEMLEGEDWDHRVDLWSVGALMYVLLTRCEVDFGEPDEPLGIPPPAVLVPAVSQALSDVVMRALAPADRRFSSATDMATAIREALPERERPRRGAWRGVDGRAALAGMAFAAVVAVLGTVTAQRAFGTPMIPSHASVTQPAPASVPPSPKSTEPTTMPSDAVEPAAVTQPAPAAVPATQPAPASVPALVSPPPMTEPVVVSPPPTAAPPAPTPEPPAAAAPAQAKKATWETVKRKVKRQALELAACSDDEFIILGLHVISGRAELETVDGKPASEIHSCAREVVARLRFAGGDLRGVVAVPLTTD